MFRQSVLFSSLILISLSSFIGCQLEPAKAATKEDIDPHCVNDEGLTWKEDCNSCWCVAGGKKACTRKLCIPKDILEKAESKPTGAPEASQTNELTDPRCQVPYASFKDDCNTCVCLRVGVPACTRMKCVSVRFGSENNQTSDDEDARCLSGNLTTPWNYKCNTCFCIPGLGAACTRMKCPPSQAAPVKTKRDTKSQRVMEAFVGEENVQADQPRSNHSWQPSHLLLMNSGTQVFPGVWTATAALSIITAALARI